jgi:hypothetical protein
MGLAALTHPTAKSRERRKFFFFEKKKQKTFDYFGFGLSSYSEPRRVKVFCFFFSKKKSFLT